MTRAVLVVMIFDAVVGGVAVVVVVVSVDVARAVGDDRDVGYMLP